MDADELPFVYEKGLRLLPTFAGGAGLARLPGCAISIPAFPLGQGRGRRAGAGCCIARSRAVRDGDGLHPRHRGHRQGRREKARMSIPNATVSMAQAAKRSPLVTQTTGLPRRRRLRRAARARRRPSHPIPGRAPDLGLRSTESAGGRADLSAQRRPQSVACRSGVSPWGGRAFRGPILHGLASFGIACHGILNMSLRS